jgi:hypothetical protein
MIPMWSLFARHRVVLVTFAGRRDRMESLIRCVREAMCRGLIDEWHVWNFSRKPADDIWLGNNFRLSAGRRTIWSISRPVD